MISFSSSVSPCARTGVPASSPALTLSSTTSSAFASSPAFPPAFAIFWVRSRRFSTVSMSFRQSSVSTTSLSRSGFTEPSTWVMLSSTKQRST